MTQVFYVDISSCDIKDSDMLSLAPLRRSYVNTITDDIRKKQSVLVWKLLIYALKRVKKEVVDFQFDLLDNGKWLLKNCDLEFSLSHSKNIVTVAVSDREVGVDVECCQDKIKKAKNMLIKTEKCGDVSVLELTRLWTEKECKIKAKNGKIMSGITIDDLHNNKYYCSVYSIEEVNSFNEISVNEIL